MRLGEPAKMQSAINVTPLVDVVLVLLIIFMVITPMLQKGPPVVLPTTADPPKKPEDKNQILIAVAADRNYYMESKTPLSETEFVSRITEAFERNSKASIVIKGDAKLTYGDVKKAMLKVKGVGFQQVGLIAQRQER